MKTPERIEGSLESLTPEQEASTDTPSHVDGVSACEHQPGPTLRDVAGVTPSLLVRGQSVEAVSDQFWGQDTAAGALNLASVTVSEAGRNDLASVGLCFNPLDRVLTNTGQHVIDQIRQQNPDFEFFSYYKFGNILVNDAGLARPLDSYETNLLTPYVAQDVNGDPAVAWAPDLDPANDPTQLWVNYCWPRTPGYLFNKDLIDQQIDNLAASIRAVEHKPGGLCLDYLNPSRFGYYMIAAFNAALDLKGEGVALLDDPEQQAAFKAFQEYFVDALHDEFGDDFMIIANGSAAFPHVEPDLCAKLHGAYIEDHPTSPFLGNPWDVFEILENVRADPSQYLDYQGRHADVGMPVYIFQAQGDEPKTSTRHAVNRVSALMYDCVFGNLPTTISGSIDEDDIVDAVWDSYTALSDPDPMSVQSVTTSRLYARRFNNGESPSSNAFVFLSSTSSGMFQVVNVGVS